MTLNKKRGLRIALLFAVTVIACAVALCLAVTPVLNTEQVKTRLTQILQDQTGLNVRFDQLSVTFTPLPGVSITDISAQIDPHTQVSINKALVELAPVQLLKFKTAVRRITLQSPELTGTIAVTGGHHTTVTPNLTAFLRNGLDRLFDLPFTDPEHLDINITNARSDFFGAMDCRVQMTPRTRAMTLTAQVSELDLKTKRISQLDAVLKGRITDLKIPHLSLVCRHDENTRLAGSVTITSLGAYLQAPNESPIDAKNFNLEFNLSKEKITAHLAPLELVYPKGEVGIDVSLSLGQPSSSLVFTGKQIDIGQARQVCLPLLDGLETSEILFDILRAGKAQNVTVGFKSNHICDLFKTKALFIEGSSDSATVKIPEVPVIVHNAAGRAEMKDGVLSIHPEGGHVGNINITGGDLDINLNHHHTVPFSGEFPLKVDLSELPATLSSLLPDTALAREMSKISNLSGRADAVLELNYTQAHKDLDVKVTAKNLQAEGTYQRLPLPIHITGGTFLFDKGAVSLKDISGAIGKSTISNLNAGIDTRGTVPMHIKSMAADIVLAQTATLGDLFPEVRKKFSLVQNISGTMEIEDLSVEGPMFSPDLWQGHITGQMNNAAVIFQNNAKGISDLFCNVIYDFSPTAETITLSDIKSTLTALSWLEKAISPDYLQSIILPLTLTQTQFVKLPDDCLFQGQLITTSGAKVSFTADGPALDTMSPSKVQIVDGELTHADVTFNKQPDMPRMDFSGKLDKATLEKMFYPDSYLHKKLQAVTGDTPFIVSTDSPNSISITADTLNIDPLLTAQQNDTSADTRPLVKQKQIFLNIDTLGYGQRVYQQVKAKVTVNHPVMDIDISHALFCNLDLSGQITIDHAGDKPKVSTHILLNADQEKDVALSIGCLTGSESVIEGSYTLGGELSGVAQTLSQVEYKQNGHLEFKAQSGRIFKATLLSRLLSMLNILGDTDLQQQGFGFKTFTAEAEVKDSVVHINKAFIDADNMAIIAEGWADPLNDALDITLLVAPFKTIDTIIKYIPIVNTILNGRLVSLPARAYGKISDPTVIPLHPSAVGKGLLNLLGDLIKTPGRLIDEIKDDKK
nr:AsmA-like C-terminal domain-containing protein [uncultured Desulfobacter sp.]